jgi:hypothetical protein
MITFKMDFDDDKFRRSVGKQAKESINSKLAAAGLSHKVKVTFTEDSHGVPLKVNISGDEDDVAKAKKILGVK